MDTKLDEIRPFLFDVPKTTKDTGAGQEEAQSSGSSIRADQHFLCIGMRDRSKKRSIYYNIIASDHPHAIRLPDLMIDMSQGIPIQAILLAELIPIPMIQEHVGEKVCLCLYGRQGPTVHVAEENDQNLVINVPVHRPHIPMLRRSLVGEVKSAFYGTITTYYRERFLAISRRSDVQSNDNMWPVERDIKFMKPGRVATEDEIHSLLLVKKGTPKEYTLFTLMRELHLDS